MEGVGSYSHPLSGLEWSPTWYPILVSHKNSNITSLANLSMASLILYADLLEGSCTFLPPSLRKELLGLALKQEMTRATNLRLLEQEISRSTILLLNSWTEPVLSLKSILPTISHEPELVGDWHKQFKATTAGSLSVAILLQLVIKKVISTVAKNSCAVKCLDLSGFPVLRSWLEELLKERFNSRETLTILLDVWIPEHGQGDSNWIKILKGSKNFTLIVQNIYCCSLREPVRNKVIASALKTNQNVKGLKLSSLNLDDWSEVNRMLIVIKTCTKISILDLSRTNVFNYSPYELVGRSPVNEALRTLSCLSRLDLSFNLLTDSIGQVLEGLNLSYLNLTASHLSTGDLQGLISFQALVHLVLTQNSIGDFFCDLLSKPNLLVNMEILELEECSISPTNFVFLLSFIKSCPSLKILNLRYNTLQFRQIIQLIKLRLEVLLVFSWVVCTCTASQCCCYEEGQMIVSHCLESVGYRVKTFDKESLSTDGDKFIIFKAFLSPNL